MRFCWNCGGYDALRPSRNTCPTTCSKREHKWWDDALVAEPTASASTSAAAEPVPDDLRDVLRDIYRRGTSFFAQGGGGRR